MPKNIKQFTILYLHVGPKLSTQLIYSPSKRNFLILYLMGDYLNPLCLLTPNYSLYIQIILNLIVHVMRGPLL